VAWEFGVARGGVRPVATGAAPTGAATFGGGAAGSGGATHVKRNDRRSATLSSASRSSTVRSIAPTKPSGGRNAALLSSEAGKRQLPAADGRPADIVDPTGSPLISNEALAVAPTTHTPSGIASSPVPGAVCTIASRARDQTGCSSDPCVRRSTASCNRGSVTSASAG